MLTTDGRYAEAEGLGETVGGTLWVLTTDAGEGVLTTDVTRNRAVTIQEPARQIGRGFHAELTSK